MKNRVTIKSAQGEYLQHVIFEELSAQEAWLQMLHDTHAWGKPEHQVVVTEALYDEETGEILEEAVYETIPAEYTIEIEDIAAQVDQERINNEAQAFLDSTDAFVIRFMETGVEMPEGMSEARQDAREKIVR